jgi:hypothetical protein
MLCAYIGLTRYDTIFVIADQNYRVQLIWTPGCGSLVLMKLVMKTTLWSYQSYCLTLYSLQSVSINYFVDHHTHECIIG